MPRRIDVYVAVQLVLVLAAALLSMVFGARVSAGSSALLAVEILAATAVWGALLDGRRWGWWLEWARLGSLGALAIAWGLTAGPLAVAGPLAAVAGFGAWSARLAALHAPPPRAAPG